MFERYFHLNKVQNCLIVLFRYFISLKCDYKHKSIVLIPFTIFSKMFITKLKNLYLKLANQI